MRRVKNAMVFGIFCLKWYLLGFLRAPVPPRARVLAGGVLLNRCSMSPGLIGSFCFKRGSRALCLARRVS